ncbi:Oidioi.mRNA.OKI2018_I69.XSR.g16861.t1.cds [Oikopleura dioica]|uniref:Oidioi.mRNA.OKI2018_I69.XSR.g16861.t1.cds n=1 Tax=Oikopleura dioica TaxID=34765 RepID=A0ABN7SML0_OIKDI|nr:Oidioi.mRNA.OKI2018_I69.XSR.g16861.t1.cds [Oikopleura dioica]
MENLEISLKQNFGDFPKRKTNSTTLKKLPDFEEQLLKTEKSENGKSCECDIPPAIGQAIIQQQLRMDLVLSEKSTMALELKSRKEENEFLAIEVQKLKDERQQILSVVSEYQHEVKDANGKNALTDAHPKHRLQNARFRCAGHGKKKGSFCFNLSKDKRSWEAAEQRCNRQGGSLAVIKDEDTMLYITNLIRGSSYDTSYWVGLSLDKESDRLSWVDNTTVTESSFQNWYGEIRPTRSERCIQSAGLQFGYKWYPSKCDREFRYICQV